MLYREIIDVCSQIHTTHINTAVWVERRILFQPEVYIKTQPVPRSKHTASVIKSSQLMLYREIIVLCSQTHRIHINTAVWAERRILFQPELYIKTQSIPRSKHTASLL